MAEIPTFPEFTPIEGGLQQQINEYTKRHPPYSDFNFVNLLSWDIEGDARITRLHDNLAICLPDYVNGVPFYSFLGDNEVDATTSALLDEAEYHTSLRQLRLVPEVGALALEASGKFDIIEDPGGHDYVVSLPEICAMQGPGFKHLRQELNFFSSRYEKDTRFEELDITDPQTQGDIYKVFLKREQIKSDNNHGNNHGSELMALTRLFTLVDLSALRAFGLVIDDELKAFIICERIDDSWCTGHFWKAATRYRGIYRYFMCRVAERLVEEGYNKLNIEQDLGIAGLRRMKQLFNPAGLLKKYTVTDRV
jgi:uncharacterized protein